MENGIKSDSVKIPVSEFYGPVRNWGYLGRIAVYENGNRLWSKRSSIIRLSRGDSLKDARIMAHDLILESFDNNKPYQKKED